MLSATTMDGSTLGQGPLDRGQNATQISFYLQWRLVKNQNISVNSGMVNKHKRQLSLPKQVSPSLSKFRLIWLGLQLQRNLSRLRSHRPANLQRKRVHPLPCMKMPAVLMMINQRSFALARLNLASQKLCEKYLQPSYWTNAITLPTILHQ